MTKPAGHTPSSDAASPPADAADLPFEQALERLEGLVSQLEEGDLDLEASLAAFEEGVGLTRHCQGHLERAERRIEVLRKSGGELGVAPFDAGDED